MGQTISSLGQAVTNPNTYAPDPSGFNGSEWAARFGGAAAKGLGQGMQNMQQQNAMRRQGGGGMAQVPPSPQPPVDLSATIMQNPQGGGPGTGQFGSLKKQQGQGNPFYGG